MTTLIQIKHALVLTNLILDATIAGHLSTICNTNNYSWLQVEWTATLYYKNKKISKHFDLPPSDFFY